MKTQTELIISLENEVDLCFEAKKTCDNDGPLYRSTKDPALSSVCCCGYADFNSICCKRQRKIEIVMLIENKIK